ncbi:MAG TPA: indolepyruvate ferredoxin oxidoreductase subunit alpha [Firmicutes bacterium]|nr:indolepyruvate ferredoxin oxidoreductase subunit alpha [Bacillota bacterium]
MTKKLLSGNEAIARGAYEAGVRVAAAYPGTPSTEILEHLAHYREVAAQWSCNEKVALEVGIGASFAGARVLVAMKHVGVNVAADPLMTLSYTGVNGGLVLVVADDPGMHSSQNEQDSRNYARFAKIPMLEPSDSQEARDFVMAALEMSEAFDTPVMLRSSTRISHGQSLVTLGRREEVPLRLYVKDANKRVMMPAAARQRHAAVEERLLRLQEAAEKSPLNRIEWRDRKTGIICSGISYQQVREALPEASVLKLGICYPLPPALIAAFAAGVDKLYVVEELDPFLEDQIKAMGIKVTGKSLFPLTGEIHPNRIAAAIAGKPLATPLPVPEDTPVPARPPVLCPGCPHRSVFYALKQQKLLVSGDIGCYTLGALPPLGAMDSCICMGASISAGLGYEKGNPELKGKVVSVIGDSTFFHSGLTGLMDVVYNQGSTLTIILDNRITAMTGHQHNPGTGYTLQGDATAALEIAPICRALGVRRVREVDPYDIRALQAAIKEEAAADEPSVIISRRACALLDKSAKPLYEINDNCRNCGACMRLGCPAIAREGDSVTIDPALCVGCGVCAQVCSFNAIGKAGATTDDENN